MCTFIHASGAVATAAIAIRVVKLTASQPSAETDGYSNPRKNSGKPRVAWFRKRSSRRLESMAIAADDSKNALFLRRSI